MKSRSEPPAAIEVNLVEFSDRRGKPHLTGLFGDAVVKVYVTREKLDPATGQTRREWRLVVERRP